MEARGIESEAIQGNLLVTNYTHTGMSHNHKQ